MICFFDTSILIKKYITEKGSEETRKFLSNASLIVVSPTCKLECYSVISRMNTAKELTPKDADYLFKEIESDFSFFEIIPFDEVLQEITLQVIRKHQLRTLDSIQLASALSIHNLDHFFVNDDKLKKSGIAEKLPVLDPTT